ncbi:MAG TPA: type II secretion system F family protein [Dehalococcoidia bacterium]|nr:type II secretion system F family protein [Dehalococcoidia bacterium]
MAGLIALVSAIGTAALVYAVAIRGHYARTALETRLGRAIGRGQAAAPRDVGPALRGSRMARSAALSRTMESVRPLQHVGTLLERAAWRLSVVEFLTLSAVTAIAGGFLVSLRLPALLAPCALLGGLLPYVFLWRAVKKRRNKFVSQLVDALTMMANALRAGVGLLQAMDQVADQMKPPIAHEFKRLLRDIRLGATPDDAFMALNERIKSPDLDIVLTAIIVQRSTGGNLAEILDNVSATMRDRIKLRGEIKTLTAQQQLSGYLVGGVPIALLLLFNLMNHTYVAPLFSTSAGHVLLGIGGTMELIGYFFIRKIVNIEV